LARQPVLELRVEVRDLQEPLQVPERELELGPQGPDFAQKMLLQLH
jgi:hypothetical protein